MAFDVSSFHAFANRLLTRLGDGRDKIQRVGAFLAERIGAWLGALKKIGDLPLPSMDFLERLKPRPGNSALMDNLQDTKERVAQRLSERLTALWWRVEMRWAAFWRRLSGTSHKMAEKLADQENVLENRIERLFPVFTQMLHNAANPVRWLRQDRRRGLVLASVLFLMSFGTLLFRLGAFTPHDDSGYANNHVLLYDLNTRRLKAFPPGTQPGANGSAGILMYTHPDGPQPKIGMTLEELQQAGMVVSWLYRLDTGNWIGQYASPDEPETWIDDDSRGFKGWLNRRQAEVKKRAGDSPLVPCLTRIGDLKRATAESTPK